MIVRFTLIAVIALAVTFLIGVPLGAGGIWFVVVTSGGPSEYTLWTSYTASINCGRALLYGSDPRAWCEDGIGGLKPKVGVLDHGTEVEILDDTECRDLIHARVVTGPLKGRVGCVVARALSPLRPESPAAP